MKKLLTAALLGAALLTGTAGAVVEPTDAFYVADYADVLSEETEQYIIDQNEALFEATGGQIVVVAVDFMDGMDSADYAMAVAENWGGIGDEPPSFVLTFCAQFLSGRGGWALLPETLLGDSVAFLPSWTLWTRAVPLPLPQVLTECLIPDLAAGP